MKAFIAGLTFLVATIPISWAQEALTTQPLTLCMSRPQASAMPAANKRDQRLRVTQVGTDEIRIERLREPAKFWIFRAENQTMSRDTARELCKSRHEFRQKARMASTIEGLKQNSHLALVFLLQMAVASGNDLACLSIEDGRIFKLVQQEGAESSYVGDQLHASLSPEGENGALELVLMDLRQGYVYHPEGCRFPPPGSRNYTH
ncbi:MAG: hypothetical protein AB7N80_08715 [Bdellovibrionales bacterium]